MSRVERLVPVGQETYCKGCGNLFKSGYQCGPFSRGEYCDPQCSRAAQRAGLRLPKSGPPAKLDPLTEAALIALQYPRTPEEPAE